jgi:hypothetical protein
MCIGLLYCFSTFNLANFSTFYFLRNGVRGVLQKERHSACFPLLLLVVHFIYIFLYTIDVFNNFASKGLIFVVHGILLYKNMYNHKFSFLAYFRSQREKVGLWNYVLSVCLHLCPLCHLLKNKIIITFSLQLMLLKFTSKSYCLTSTTPRWWLWFLRGTKKVLWHVKDAYSMKDILLGKLHRHFLQSHSCFATRCLLVAARELW